MSRRVMPLLILNLAGEMVYILCERLAIAEDVDPEQARKVIAKILLTVTNKEFLEQLAKPQDIYGRVPAKAVFERLCRSAGIDLSMESLAKMYDVMLMTLKHQVLSLLSPRHLLDVTLNHLDAVQGIVYDHSEAMQSVKTASIFIEDMYTNLTDGDWIFIRQTLLCFVQGKHDRITVLLDKGIQNQDGRFAIKINGPVPPGSSVPGMITQYSESGNKTTFFNYGGVCEDPKLESRSKRRTSIGSNLYETVEGRRIISPSSWVGDEPPAYGGTPNTATVPENVLYESRGTILMEENSDVNSGLELLSRLIGIEHAARDISTDFRLQLAFDDDQLDNDNGFRHHNGQTSATQTHTNPNITHTGQRHSGRMQELMSEFNDVTSPNSDDVDDLMDLIDLAT